jgi:hypothetical protein
MQRRSIIKGLGGTGLVLGAPSFFIHSAQAATFDPKNPDHVAMAHRKMVYTADDSVTFTWLRATRYIMIDSVLTPLWELHSGMMYRTVDRPDGGYDVHAISSIYYTELETEKYIETFKNPFTGKTVTFPYALPTAPKPAVRVTHFTKTGPAEEPVNATGVKVAVRNNRLGPAWVVGYQVILCGDSSMRLEPTEPGKRMSQVNDWLTYTSRVAEVMDPNSKNVQSNQAFNDLNTIPVWFGMEDRAGNWIGRGFGKKVFKFDDLPPIWRNLFTAKNPGIAKDIRGALGA